MCTGGGTRKRVAFEAETNTIFLNTAVVPRVIGHQQEGSLHHFCLVDISDGAITKAKDIWVKVTRNHCTIEHETTLFERGNQSDADPAWLLNTHTNEREYLSVNLPPNSIMEGIENSQL